MRVALLTPAAWPEARGDKQRFAIDLARGLTGRGHNVSLITGRATLTTRVDEKEAQIGRSRRPPPGPLERRQFESHLTHVPLSYLSLIRDNAELAHAMHPAAALAAARWTLRTGHPSLLTAPGIAHRRSLVSRRRRLQVAVRATAGVSAVSVWSHAAAEAWQRWLGIDARVVYPGIAPPVMSPAAVRAQAPTIFAPVDAGESDDRVSLLLGGFARLRRELPEARLLLGRVSQEDKADQSAMLAPGVAWVQIDGRQGRAEAHAGAWVVALPSCRGAFPFRLVEALAGGTPVVAPREGAVLEVVGDGALVALFDPAHAGPAQVAETLREALARSEQPDIPAACRAHAQRFSLERSLDAHVALYRELLER